MNERLPSPPRDDAEARAVVVLDKLGLLNKEGSERMLTLLALAIWEAIEEDGRRPRVVQFGKATPYAFEELAGGRLRLWRVIGGKIVAVEIAPESSGND